jgi:hypothetical protein
MTMCLSNETLLAVRLGEALPAAAAHAGECALCAGRLTSMQADLARIDAILAPPPSRVAPPLRTSIAIRLAPLMVAAAAALVLFVARGDRSAVAPAPATIVNVASIAHEMSGAFEHVDDEGDGDDTDDGDGDGNDDNTDEASWTVSTCALDEPFIGVGCDNGVQLTVLDW